MMNPQTQLDEMQSLYRQWLTLLPQLQEHLRTWKEAINIIQQLEHFYYNGNYLRLRDLEQQGHPLNTHTQGEYSVLSEDAIWDALSECHQLAWQHLRSAIAVLDQENQ